VLESARQAAPGEATVWNGLGLVELALGRRPQALESWRRAAELRPEYAEAQVNHGQLLVETGDFPGAVRALELAVKHSPASAPAWLDLGNAHRGAGRLDEAQRAYERALAVDPGTSDAWFDLGVLWLDGERSGMTTVARLEKAVECLDRFAAAGGQDPALPAYRAEAQSLLEKERRRLAREAQARADRGRP
jgi:tetratricopeptide (TPR) repeat protein